VHRGCPLARQSIEQIFKVASESLKGRPTLWVDLTALEGHLKEIRGAVVLYHTGEGEVVDAKIIGAGQDIRVCVASVGCEYRKLKLM